MMRTLKEWMALDKATRQAVEAECYRRGTPRQIGELAEEAAKVLASELKGKSQVATVTAAEDKLAKHSMLLVTTLLPAGSKLKEIPEEYAGFPVKQHGIADRKRDYLQQVEFVLHAADLSQVDVETVLKRFSNSLNSVNSAYYTDTPAKWIADALTSTILKGRLVGDPLVRLKIELQNLLFYYFQEFDPACIGTDPKAAKRLHAVLQKLFAEYGFNI